MPGRLRLHLLVAAWMMLTALGCATGAKPENMIVRDAVVSRTPGAAVAVRVTGGEKTNPMGKSTIDNESFAAALAASIRASGPFALVVENGPSPYRLDVTLMRVMTPNVGLDLTSTVVAQWQLTSQSSNAVLMNEHISTTHTAAFSEAFAAIKRLRLSVEGAARANIREGLSRLAKIDLTSSTFAR